MTQPFRLKDLSVSALSTQLQTLTGDSYNTHDFHNKENPDDLTAQGVIVHKKTGLEFEVPDADSEMEIMDFSRVSSILTKHAEAGFGASLDEFMSPDEKWQLHRVMQGMPGSFNALATLEYMKSRCSTEGDFVQKAIQPFTPEPDTTVIEALKHNARIEIIDDMLEGEGVFLQGVGHQTLLQERDPKIVPHIKVGILGSDEPTSVHYTRYQEVEAALQDAQALRTGVNKSTNAPLTLTPLSRMTISEDGRPSLSDQDANIHIMIPTQRKDLQLEINPKDGFVAYNHAESTAILPDKSGVENVFAHARSEYMNHSSMFPVEKNTLTVSDVDVRLNVPTDKKDIITAEHDGTLNDIRGAIMEIQRNAAQQNIDIEKTVNLTTFSRDEVFGSTLGLRIR